jgi:glycogen operon protein
VVARLPDADWDVGLVSGPSANVAMVEATATLTPRSVTALVRPAGS